MNFIRRARSGGSGADDDQPKRQDQTAYERRRQQVRRAQRNHRERKQNYIKALEQEVVNLRRQNQQNIREFENEISMLHRLLMHHGLTPPARQARIINAPDLDVDVYYPSSYTVSKPPGLGQPLLLHCPPGMGQDLSQSISTVALDPAKSEKSSSAHGASAASASAAARESLSPPAAGSSADPLARPGSPLLSAGLTPSAIDKIHGIGFVLALEHPCMHHPEITRDEFGTHSHMASHNLLAFAPQDLHGPATWEVPGADIERLLALSTSFQLQGEITPVQAWYRLKQHPRFSMLNEAQLKRLRQLLATDVKCYGFGSVMDEQIWMLAVEEVFMLEGGN